MDSFLRAYVLSEMFRIKNEVQGIISTGA